MGSYFSPRSFFDNVITGVLLMAMFGHVEAVSKNDGDETSSLTRIECEANFNRENGRYLIYAFFVQLHIKFIKMFSNDECTT